MENIKKALQAAVDTYDRKGGVAPVLTRNTLQLFRAALSELEGSKPKEQGAEPVAWMRRWAFDKNEGTRGNRPLGWGLQAVTGSRLLPDDVPLFATAPSAREKAMEEAGEEVIKAYRGFHEAIEQHTGKPYPWDPMVSAIEKWTTAKSTK